MPVAGPDRREPEGEGVESIKSRRGGERAAAGQMGTVITVYIPRRIYAIQTSVMVMARMIGHGAKIEGVAVRTPATGWDSFIFPNVTAQR